MVDTAKLLSRIELYDLDPDHMSRVLEECVYEFGLDYKSFQDVYLNNNKAYIKEFQGKVHGLDYKFIRRNKKLHFWANPGMIKISTIHSFKGWESHTIIMLVTPGTTEDVLDELLYVGITRAKTNLFIFNFGNILFEERLKACRDRQGNPIISI